MSTASFDTIYTRLRAAGAAIGTINGNNTHSGNLSMRDPAERDRFYITASGSMCGALIPQDIVPLSFTDVRWGDGRASTESTIHRRVLSLPGVNAVIHAHFFNTTVVSFDTRKRELFLRYLGSDEKEREEFLFLPVDYYGSSCVGAVRVGTYLQPVGSAEMEERIPRYLTDDTLTIVRGHGSFVRGASVEEALHLMCTLEISAGIAVHLVRRGIDPHPLQEFFRSPGAGGHKAAPLPRFRDLDVSRCDVSDPTVIEDFRQRLIYNFNNSLSGFGTGSMSQKISADTMIYCPMAACPPGYDVPLYRLSTAADEGDAADLAIHKLIYRHTHQNTCMITVSPMAVAEAMAVMADEWGAEAVLDEQGRVPYGKDRHPVIKPIDAEAIYLNPRVGLTSFSVIGDLSGDNPILNMLHWYKGCCAVAGFGIISTGDTTLEQAAHNAASAERIARFRTDVYINSKIAGGPPVADFEP
ncbi:class II aldolase/adducin family protein [bacterium]|nr:class II aldolase/adducin family protein [bacterium]